MTATTYVCYYCEGWGYVQRIASKSRVICPWCNGTGQDDNKADLSKGFPEISQRFGVKLEGKK